MPVGYPAVYSSYLAKRQGPFATLGLAEDTWALNEHVIIDDQFIQQCLDMDSEREAMFFDALDKVPRGLWSSASSTAPTGSSTRSGATSTTTTPPARPRGARRAATSSRTCTAAWTTSSARRWPSATAEDTLLDGDLRPRLRPVPPGRRPEPLAGGKRLPRSCMEGRRRRGAPRRGRLVANPGVRHRAGRDLYQHQGQVLRRASSIRAPRPTGCARRSPSASTALVDPESGASAVKRVYVASKFYRGPYKENGPDLIVGYQRGIPRLVGDGHRPDHRAGLPREHQGLERRPLRGSLARARHPLLQPRRCETENPRLIDVGPTVLNLFGVAVPDYMDGKALGRGRSPRETRRRGPRARSAEVALMAEAAPGKVSRDGLSGGLGRTAAAGAAGCGVPATTGSAAASRVSRAAGKKVIVIGVDGMDPRLSERMMKAGQLPNLAKLRSGGGFSALGTSVPPQSPVAWATFINGAGPGSHGIFDFIHRHPRSSAPRSTRPPRPCRAKASGRSATTSSSSTSGRSTTSRPPRSCGGRGRRSGTTSTPRESPRRSTTSLKLPRQPLAPRPPPLPLRHGHARHAGHLRHLSALRRERAR